MKLSVKSLGPIAAAELAVRPMTVLVGENSTGKSWLAYSLFGLLRLMAFGPPGRIPRPGSSPDTLARVIRPAALAAARQIRAAAGRSNVQLEYSKSELLKGVVGSLTLGLDDAQLSDLLGTTLPKSRQRAVTLSIDPRELESGPSWFTIRVPKDGSFIYASSDKSLQGLSLDPFDSRDELWNKAAVRSLTWNRVFGGGNKWSRHLQDVMTRFALQDFTDTWAFPAERKALVALYDAVGRSRFAPELPLPMRNFIERVSNQANDKGYPTGFRRRDSSGLHTKLLQLLGGELTFQDGAHSRQLELRVDKRTKLPIVAASSLAKSLSALSLVLDRLVVGNNTNRTVLVVDEPEMNAHPSAQLAIVELLAALANKGHLVIVTTHSPYVIDHLNNLLLAGRLGDKARRVISNKFALGDSGCFLDSKTLGAWEVSRKGGVTSLLQQDGSLKASSIGATSSVIENLHATLLERLNN